MKDKKQVRLLAAMGVFFILAAGYAGIHYWNQKQETQSQEEDTSIGLAHLPEEEITEITFGGDQPLTFIKEEDIWYYEEDRNFPVSQDAMTTMLAPLTNLSSERQIEDAQELKEYGLEEPASVITVTKEDESVTEISLGNENSSVGKCYGYLNGDTSKIYLLSTSLLTNFDVGLYDLAEYDSFPAITGTTITDFSVQKEEEHFKISKNGESSTGWMIQDWDGSSKEAGSSEVNEEFSAFSSLTFNSYVNYREEDLEAYGLEKPSTVITVDYEETAADEDTEEESEEEPEKIAKQLILYVGNTDEEGNYYVRTSETTGIYTLSSSALSPYLEETAENFLTLYPHDDSFADLEKMDFIKNGESYTIESVTTEIQDEENEEEVSTETEYYVNSEKVDGSKFLSFYDEVSSMKADRRADEAIPEGNPEYTLIFYRNNGETLNVEYYAYDNDFYLAKDGEGNGFLVNKMNVKTMADRLEAMLP